MPRPSGGGWASSAPDLTGPTSILNWPTTYAGAGRGRATRPFSHVHLEVDLAHESYRETGLPVLRTLEALLKEREVVEAEGLLRLSVRVLHALSAKGFSRVDRWETEPGGWVPLPESSHTRRVEPVGHLLRALESDEWQRLANARAFSFHLSTTGALRAAVTVRRVHRERTSALSLDVTGRFMPATVRDIEGALRSRLPVLRSRVTAFAYATGKGP